ncbi:MAG: universal stress protein [Acidimicrobiales bacterium]
MTITNEREAPGTSTDAAAERVVVVGVDGSEASSAALEWAAEEAHLRGATLRVVHAWHLPTMAYAGAGYVAVPELQSVGDDVAVALGSQVSDVLGAHPDVTLEPRVTEGPAAQVLLDAAKGAEMVVVGSHGRGGFTGLMLGSVSAQVAHHAHCPVVIVRS